MSNLNSIIKYQQLEKECHRLQELLKNSDYNKKQELAKNEFNNVKLTIAKLEEDAESLANRIPYECTKGCRKENAEGVSILKTLGKDYYEQAIKEFEEANKALQKETDEQKLAEGVELLSKCKNKIIEAERSTLDIQSKSNDIIKRYKDTQAKGAKAKAAYAHNKEQNEKQIADTQPKIKKMKDELAALRASGDKGLFERYDTLLATGVPAPVFVPLSGKDACGGCFTNNSQRTIAELTQKKTVACDNCKRIIYLVD
ncbi:MAG: hypothetical protein FWD76_00155 [Firmicutes bacterium]|nr:hypothetical protein [Bacillota bacterium]